MRHFVCFLSDKQKELMTTKLITDHVDYLKSLKLEQKLPFCGPCQDGTALMILAASSFEEAQQLLEQDPFSKVGYYKTRRIVEIQEATIENNFHLSEVLGRL